MSRSQLEYAYMVAKNNNADVLSSLRNETQIGLLDDAVTKFSVLIAPLSYA